MRALLHATLISAFFNAHAGWKLYICATVKPTALDAAAYAALTWVQITGVGSHGETGTTQNILTYDTWDDTVVQKAKGMRNAGDPEIELARDAADAGQDILRTAADTDSIYAFKIEADDTITTPTRRYNRGYVTGPRHPHGRNEDFDLEIFQLALVQTQIIVEAA